MVPLLSKDGPQESFKTEENSVGKDWVRNFCTDMLGDYIIEFCCQSFHFSSGGFKGGTNGGNCSSLNGESWLCTPYLV